MQTEAVDAVLAAVCTVGDLHPGQTLRAGVADAQLGIGIIGSSVTEGLRITIHAQQRGEEAIICVIQHRRQLHTQLSAGDLVARLVEELHFARFKATSGAALAACSNSTEQAVTGAAGCTQQQQRQQQAGDRVGSQGRRLLDRMWPSSLQVSYMPCVGLACVVLLPWLAVLTCANNGAWAWGRA